MYACVDAVRMGSVCVCVCLLKQPRLDIIPLIFNERDTCYP